MNSFYILACGFAIFLYSGMAKVKAINLVQFPVGSAAWTIDVVPSGDGQRAKILPGQGGGTITQVEVTQNDHYRRSVVTYLNGQSRVNWDIPGTSIILREDLSGNPFLVYKSDFYYVPFLPSDFAWVSLATQQEKTTIPYKSKTSLHYKEQKREAWIDSKTQLPVALDDGVNLAVYTFHPTPSEPIVLPEKYRKIVDAFSATMGIPASKPESN